MSMNALTIAELLMSRRGSAPLSQSGAYGSIVPNVPSSSNTPFRHPHQNYEVPNVTSTISNRAVPASLATNSIWGVPEEITETSEDEMERIEQGTNSVFGNRVRMQQRKDEDSSELPPSAFNV